MWYSSIFAFRESDKNLLPLGTKGSKTVGSDTNPYCVLGGKCFEQDFKVWLLHVLFYLWERLSLSLDSLYCERIRLGFRVPGFKPVLGHRRSALCGSGKPLLELLMCLENSMTVTIIWTWLDCTQEHILCCIPAFLGCRTNWIPWASKILDKHQ